MRGDKARFFEATRIFPAQHHVLTCQCSPSIRHLTHLRSGTLGSERRSVFVVCSTGTRWLGQAIFGTWTGHRTRAGCPGDQLPVSKRDPLARPPAAQLLGYLAYRCRGVKWRGSLIGRIISLIARFNSLLDRINSLFQSGGNFLIRPCNCSRIRASCGPQEA